MVPTDRCFSFTLSCLDLGSLLEISDTRGGLLHASDLHLWSLKH